MQQCPIQWNEKNGSNGSFSVSFKVEANKEADIQSYQTRNCGSSNGVLTGVADTLFQQWTTAAAETHSRRGERGNMRVSTNRK